MARLKSCPDDPLIPSQLRSGHVWVDVCLDEPTNFWLRFLPKRTCVSDGLPWCAQERIGFVKFLNRTSVYESLFLMNRGNDIIVQGMHHLGNNSHMLGRNYREAMLDLQHRRTLLNLQFLSEMQQREQGELERLEQIMHGRYANILAEASEAPSVAVASEMEPIWPAVKKSRTTKKITQSKTRKAHHRVHRG
jgi:hypothetical protein